MYLFRFPLKLLKVILVKNFTRLSVDLVLIFGDHFLELLSIHFLHQVVAQSMNLSQISD